MEVILEAARNMSTSKTIGSIPEDLQMCKCLNDLVKKKKQETDDWTLHNCPPAGFSFDV